MIVFYSVKVGKSSTNLLQDRKNALKNKNPHHQNDNEELSETLST